MRWTIANAVIEELRRDTQLYLPALSTRRGFSSSRIEYLLNTLVSKLPSTECYLEVGTLEGRTLESASINNADRQLYGIDPGSKYASEPAPFEPHVRYIPKRWQDVAAVELDQPAGVVFYDGDHSTEATAEFMLDGRRFLANEAVLVLDDWDRRTVRAGAFHAETVDPRWCLLREMPEYTDGLTAAPNHFGWYFGVSVWGWRR